MTLQLAVLQLDQGGFRSFGGKANLDFTRLGHVRVAGPIRLIVAWANVPGEGDAVRRVPRQDGAPVVLVGVDISLVPAAADARLYEDCLEGSFSDVMCGRPPRLHLFHEDAEGTCDRRLNAHTLTNDGFCHCVWVCHAAPPLVAFPLLLERRSAPGSTSGPSAHAAAPLPRDATGRGAAFRLCCR